MDLLQWQNLMFLLPLLLAVLYLLVLGLGGDGHGGHDAAHHDAGLHHDTGGEHDVGHHAESGIAKALTALGVGRIPLSLFIVILLILWGGVGLMCSQLFGLNRWLDSAGIAGLAAFFGTPFVANFVGRFITTRSYHVRREGLVGRRGQTTYTTTESAGEVRLLDQSGSLRDVSARVRPGSAEIASGVEVQLESYDGEREVFFVRAV
jgi:membrane protein implicated in regulation of membrane protease activity